jgi:hypothetical protein
MLLKRMDLFLSLARITEVSEGSECGGRKCDVQSNTPVQVDKCMNGKDIHCLAYSLASYISEPIFLKYNAREHVGKFLLWCSQTGKSEK